MLPDGYFEHIDNLAADTDRHDDQEAALERTIERQAAEIARLQAIVNAGQALGDETPELARDRLTQMTKRQLVDTVIASMGQVRLLQQELAAARSGSTLKVVEGAPPKHFLDATDLAITNLTQNRRPFDLGNPLGWTSEQIRQFEANQAMFVNLEDDEEKP